MHFFSQIQVWILAFAGRVPIVVFVTIGTILEELIGPIPAPLILTTAGSLLSIQGWPLFVLLLLCLISAAAKTLVAWALYWVGSKGEKIVVDRFGKYIGIGHKEIESFREYFNKGWIDYVTIATLRAIPIVPTTPISIVAGILNLQLAIYLSSTFVGMYVRSFIFMYIGYKGLKISHVLRDLTGIQMTMLGIVIVLLLGTAGYVYYHNQKSAKKRQK